MTLLRYSFWVFARLVLPLRYRIRVHGWEQLRSVKSGALILPNHPGYIDPAILLMKFWPSLRPRPLVFRSESSGFMFDWFLKLLNALPVPDLDKPSAEARAAAEQAIQGVIQGLRRGENFIIWPAGHVQRDGTERFGGARAVSDILQAVPEAQVVLARTRGLWGGKFTFAYTGTQPNLARQFRQAIGLFLANLLVFMPRRRLDITVERVDRQALPELRRETLNPWLQRWYNAEGPEPPAFVPYHFLFGPRAHTFPKPADLDTAVQVEPTPRTRDTIAHLLENAVHRPLSSSELEPQTRLDQELGLSSLDVMDLTLAIEQQYGFTAGRAPVTIAELWALAQGQVEKDSVKPPPPAWFDPLHGDRSLEIMGETIPEAFIAKALKSRKDVAAADDLSGAIIYERMLVGVLVMARRFARLPGANVGVMLPASVASDIVLLALYLGGKLPVVLNWTTGPANLNHAAKAMGLSHVVTARAFIDRLDIRITGVEYVWLEELRKAIGRLELLRTLLAVRFLPGRIRRRIPVTSPDQPAVVLFTSGSERAPKAVPLTHRNIINDARACIQFLKLTRDGSMLGFLPAFHSFGLVVTAVMPLIAGMRVVHHPDPTDAAGLAAKIASYKPTLLVGTPTFVGYIVDRARSGQLESLRLIIVGAEKCPAELFDRLAKLAPEGHLLEGYGITECAPVVSVNPPEATRRETVGPPLPGVEVCVVDPESGTILEGQPRMGELWISGATVFPGYLAYDGPSPFRERDGKRWYATGDLAEIDAAGYIVFRGRQKRFLKAGGEMISLPALEEPFARAYPPTQEGPRVAVEGIDVDGEHRIVLFTTESLTLRDANARLGAEGFRGVMRLDEVRKVDKIPVLGTGKVDYKVLRAEI
jgi:long-chain-fatty-acid--[acyl-carrier-protein] ligase